MFTGIIQATGRVQAIEAQASCHRLSIQTDLDLSDGQVGESIAVNGCCLTAVSFGAGGFQVDVALESLKITSLGELKIGDSVNLERALRLADRLGGHWVQGHVDGIGTLERREPAEQGELWAIAYPPDLGKYLIKKGSITVQGVSLTLNEVTPEYFEIFLIPHTLEVTTLGDLAVKTPLNLEVDILGKYIETLLAYTR